MLMVLRVDQYRFLLCANDGEEPAHIHIQSGSEEAKFWLAPIALSNNYGFNSDEITEIKRLVGLYHDKLLAAWNRHLA